jgi:hypothetical protein
MAIVTPASVEQLQADLAADYHALDAAVQSCNAAQPPGPRGAGQLDDQTLTEWQAMADRVTAFLKQSPAWISTAKQMDQGEAMQSDLAAWHERLKAHGCAVGPAPKLASESSLNLGKMFSDLTESPVLMLLAGALLLHEFGGRR